MFARPPHQGSTFTFRISCLFRISPDLSGRIMQNEPYKSNARQRRATHVFNPHGSGGNAPQNPKTQNEPNPSVRRHLPGQTTPLTRQFQQNEPNKDNARCNRATPIFNPHGSGGYAHDQKCKTNPIPPPQPPKANSQHPKNAKRTQSQDDFVETNPICPRPRLPHNPIYAKRTQFPHTTCPTTPCFGKTNPKSKRTPQACIHLFNPGLSAGVLPHPNLCETNPIYTATELWKTQKCETNPICHHATFAPPPFPRNKPNLPPSCLFPPAPITRNEPNLPHHHPHHDPKTRNEPNFPRHPASARPKNAKRTQFTAPRCSFYFLLSTFSSLLSPLSRANSPRHPIPTKAD